MSSEPKIGDSRKRDPLRKMETQFQRDASAMRARLDTVSPSMCLAKWLQVSIHLTTGLTQSCYHPPTHKIPLEEITANPSALHNTRYKKEQRKLMREGKRPAECQYCWNIEDAPGTHMSDRHYRSGESWSRSAFDEVTRNPWDYDVNPRYVEVNFNHACQLKCSYCSPHISSTWLEEIKKFGPYPTHEPHNDIEWFRTNGLMPILQSEENPYQDAFWKWWPDLYKDLYVFRMTGGEPLMDINTYKVLDYILAHPNPRLTLAITSNLCARPEQMNKFMEKIQRISNGRYIEKFLLYASIDSWGAQAEYIRNGLNFEYFLHNVDRFLSEVSTASITFIVTFNNLSIVGWRRLVDGILEFRERHSKYTQRIFFDTPLLRFPPWQSIQILPERYQGILRETIDYMKTKPSRMATRETRFCGIMDYEVARMERDLAWMRQDLPQERLILDRANFYAFFREHDRRRNTNFLASFPEMEDFWEICRESAEQLEIKEPMINEQAAAT